MSFEYELAVLTHGESRSLPTALRAFVEYVRPAPTSVRVFADASRRLEYVVGATQAAFPSLDPVVSSTHPSRQNGFCRATGRLWDACARGDAPFVFWLEHDFVVERHVSVEQLAAVLEERQDLAQMALVRGTANDVERRAGGLVESMSGVERRRSRVYADGVWWTVDWLEHRSFLTTNPSLMRRGFMATNSWPSEVDECEGRFGIDLLAQGYRFGYWGDGTPWVDHVGVRDGSGTGY